MVRCSGVSHPDPLQGPVWNRASMAIDAAIDGQGIALSRTTLAAWDLLSGRLVQRPFAESLRISKTYWIGLSEDDGVGAEGGAGPRPGCWHRPPPISAA
jgi:hypothetical protein